ncbi:MAG TPA: D-alanyl-D-alanine carboxypeptidase [Candidatus Eubacterium faecipullorum]|uniref:D-alanyl-D-alanine carboxypeptidase n=1 Tax=Candidatus Eubacterium faecipullorum TaxID=2838571 RepID=A0A9D1UFX0_9FIRM|nr:D-alanyl-D-alanine carboxypeptidase [Candidatus Eubacterium faecipullorum]
MDADTYEVLYQKNADEQRSIASTTKILPSIIACESGRLSETVTVTWDMVNTHGSLLGLREGDQITLYDLVAGMLLPSGNDAANAAAIFLAGSLEDFSALMNEKARSLGMEASYFVTPSGLDEGDHHSTARDMALLTAYAVKNSDFSEIFAMSSYEVTINGEKQTIYNHNRLLQELEGCTGGKTGFTDKAGRCLVSTAQRNGNTLVCVTLGAPDDWNDHKKLYEECFAKYESCTFTDTIAVPAVGGTKNEINCAYSAELHVLNKNLVTVELYAFPFVYCPVSAGDKLGKAVIKYKEKEIFVADITAQENAEYHYAESK